jgi:hypothetical protein
LGDRSASILDFSDILVTLAEVLGIFMPNRNCSDSDTERFKPLYYV